MITCEALTYQYPEAQNAALTDITVTIKQGEFVLLLGESGSGKSTFLRSLNGLVPRFYGGSIAGRVTWQGRDINELTQREIVSQIGFLHQDPERQILLDSIERELAFGMENIGLSHREMKMRLAEISHLFGLGNMLERRPTNLSGGEKQRIALGGILTLYPQVLLLDEPTSQLDPIHAEEVLHALRRLNEDWGMTVVMSEHRTDRCFQLADRILFFHQGRLLYDGLPREFAREAASRHPEWQSYLPPVTRFFLKRAVCDEIPITVKEARANVKRLDLEAAPSGSWQVSNHTDKPFLDIRAIVAGYPEKQAVLRKLDFSINQGDHIALFGENGAGKSTLAKVIAGLVPLSAGSMQWCGEEITTSLRKRLFGKIGYLSQNPNDYFLHESVEDELMFALKKFEQNNKDAREQRLQELLDTFSLTPYRYRHPHDLSGGERQRLALAIVLAAKPELLILDEPTRGLDQQQKEKLSALLQALSVKSVMVITHDVEFAQGYANRVTILYQGEIVADGAPHDVFSQSFSYMPQVYKLSRQ